MIILPGIIVPPKQGQGPATQGGNYEQETRLTTCTETAAGLFATTYMSTCMYYDFECVSLFIHKA